MQQHAYSSNLHTRAEISSPSIWVHLFQNQSRWRSSVNPIHRLNLPHMHSSPTLPTVVTYVSEIIETSKCTVHGVSDRTVLNHLTFNAFVGKPLQQRAIKKSLFLRSRGRGHCFATSIARYLFKRSDIAPPLHPQAFRVKMRIVSPPYRINSYQKAAAVCGRRSLNVWRRVAHWRSSFSAFG